MIILIDTEKLYDKIQHPFLIKILNQLQMEGVIFNLIKSIQKTFYKSS